MYLLTWHITIGKYRLQTLKGLKIITSVLNLSDTAEIELPGQYLNIWNEIEDKIAVGDPVTIKLGYDNNNETEFNGYLKRISRDNNSLKLECEDALFLLEKTIADKEYKTVNLKTLLTDVLKQVDEEITVESDYEFSFGKFIIFKSTALDVVKKIQEETKANIWFENKVLHIRPVYADNVQKKAVIFDTRINVQKNELKWKDERDKKIQIEVVCSKPDGTRTKETYGVKGGEKVTKYVSSGSEADMKRAAENEYNLWNYSGFEGSFTGWLIPIVRAGDSVRLRDIDKPEGKYYVTGVEIEFGQSGANRKISLGRRLG